MQKYTRNACVPEENSIPLHYLLHDRHCAEKMKPEAAISDRGVMQITH